MFLFGRYFIAAAALMGPASFIFAQPQGSLAVSAQVQAIPTQDVRSIAVSTPVNFTASFTIGQNVFGGESGFFQVPADKRLIMQYVSMECDMPGGGEARGKILSDQDHPGASSFLGVFVPMSSVPLPVRGAGAVRSTGGTPAQIVFDPNRTVQLVVDRTNGNGTASCFVGFSGYLVPKP